MILNNEKNQLTLEAARIPELKRRIEELATYGSTTAVIREDIRKLSD